MAGGKPRSNGPPYFYHADDPASLHEALGIIAGGILPSDCVFDLSQEVPDPERVTVNVDGTAIPRDPSHTSGWDYHPDASTITLFGDACQALEGGEKDVHFVFGCKGPVID